VIRAVIDTNVLVSAAIRPGGEAGRILTQLRQGMFALLYSTEVLAELIDVLNRPFLRDKYHLTPPYLHIFLHLIRLRGEKVEPTHEVKVCRDPHDDMFLALALSGQADFIVSRDNDLLVLSPFADIPIIPPALFLAELEKQGRS
jgi:putative PIN family toxin of toxin-antitoxin system